MKYIPYRRDKFNQTDKIKILYLYSKFINTQKLVDYLNNKYQYNLTINRLKDYAYENHVKKIKQNMYSQSRVTRKEEYQILELYNSGYSSKKLAKLYGYKTNKSILDKISKLNGRIRNWNEQQSKNKSYFGFSMEKLDSKFKAYFLGLILTDGYINEKRGYVRIDLSDIDVIEFISKNINIKYTAIKGENIKSKFNIKDKYRIIIYGRKIVDDFKRLGVFAKKTFIAKGPNLREDEIKYSPYIIRGTIDGDGWIRKDGHEFFISSASEQLINWCRDTLIELKFEDINIRFIENKSKGIYLIRSAKKHNLDMLKKKIYPSEFGMIRKYSLLL